MSKLRGRRSPADRAGARRPLRLSSRRRAVLPAPSAPTAADALICGDPARALTIAQHVMTQPRMATTIAASGATPGRPPAGRLTSRRPGSARRARSPCSRARRSRGPAAIRIGTCAAIAPTPALGASVVAGPRIGARRRQRRARRRPARSAGPGPDGRPRRGRRGADGAGRQRRPPTPRPESRAAGAGPRGRRRAFDLQSRGGPRRSAARVGVAVAAACSSPRRRRAGPRTSRSRVAGPAGWRLRKRRGEPPGRESLRPRLEGP